MGEFDPKIGPNPNNSGHVGIITDLKIPLVFHNVPLILKRVEPEGKLCLPTPRSANSFINAVEQSSNGLFFVGQGGLKKHVLISCEIDTPDGKFAQRGISLRFRFEFDERTKEMRQCELSMKSHIKGDTKRLIGGMVCREEIEDRLDHREPLGPQFQEFFKMVRAGGSKMKCNDINIDDLNIYTLTSAIRADHSVFIKHPKQPVGLGYHACTDLVIFSNVFGIRFNGQPTVELEMECSALVGDLPKSYANTDAGKRKFLVECLNGFTGYAKSKIIGATSNEMSKLERASMHHLSSCCADFNHANRALLPSLTLPEFIDMDKNYLVPIALDLIKAAKVLKMPSETQGFTNGQPITFGRRGHEMPKAAEPTSPTLAA